MGKGVRTGGTVNILDFLRVNTSEDRFAKQVIKRLRDKGWSSGIQYDRQNFALSLDGGTGRIFLHNIYREWSAASRADKSRELDRAIAFMFEPEVVDGFEESAPLLLPAIRNRTGVVSQWLDPALGMDRNHYEGALRPFCDGLAIVIAVDQPTAINLVNQNQLSQWGRSLDEVLAIAINNLNTRSLPSFDRFDDGFYCSSFNDYYDASRLLIPRLFEDLSLLGDPVAIAVSRSGIVVAGSEDMDALQAMAAFVENHAEEETRPISNLPLVLRGGEWQLFDCLSPQLAALDRLRAVQWLQDYADQKALLDPYFERTGRDVYVATLSGIKDEERVRTWTSWTSEAVSLLPEADVVAMKNGANRSMVRRWADVIEHCGPLKLEPGLYPRRYLVEKGPDEDAWERLTRCEHPAWFPKHSVGVQ
jgi:hypothetical protein